MKKHKVLLVSVVAMFLSAPLIENGNENVAMLGLMIGLAGVFGLWLIAWRNF